MGVLDDEEDDKEDEARQHGALRKVCVFMSESMQGVAKLGLDSKIPPKAIVEMAEGVVVVAVRARHAHWAGQSRSFHQRPHLLQWLGGRERERARYIPGDAAHWQWPPAPVACQGYEDGDARPPQQPRLSDVPPGGSRVNGPR
eukprot:scaffold3574_cov121-Isochrysis_galbana.AAC.3